METRDGRQKGPQEHAEGQHGEKAHARFLEELHQPVRRGDGDTDDGGENESGRDDRQRR